MEDDGGRRRPWLALFLLGLALHAYAAFNSDLGLDAHVRLNVINDDSVDGADAPWGSPRISGDASKSGASTFDGYIPPWNTSEFLMKTTAVLALAVVGLLVSINPSQSTTSRFDFTWGALLLLSPVLMFSTSRGYDEASLALLMGLGVAGFGRKVNDQRAQLRMHSVLMATSLLLVLGWKGFNIVTCFSVWFAVLVLAEGWMAMILRQNSPSSSWLVHPWKMGAFSSACLFIGVFLVGLVSSNGTFSTIGERPVHFLVATVFALLDTVVLYLLVGCLLWPMVIRRWRSLSEVRGPVHTMLVVYIFTVLTGVILYIAALWTLESSLWGLSLPETMIVLGNNGRYATLILIPLIVLLKSVEPRKTAESPRWVAPLTAVALVLPFLVFTTVVGHQVWSEDAGERLAEVWQEEDRSFLLVAPQSLAMHHLYAMKTHVDIDGSKGVVGHWVVPENASHRLDAELEVDYLIVGPNAEFSVSDEAWVLMDSSSVPVNIPGGIQSGMWSLYRTAA